ncbi:2-succinyl-5-enolpyruvyl-6-hydroxy-3-cyclohexene-1-carboxylic-acid synthase [Halobacteriaceae archaeon SHR40]|uniref:2-succinyl-5-enolpyruvyl-6-hydroxy-3- cyclohexene-1-carboxylic-acid synthase n=1 Tax=Halovenus amylolytica TaxID=2500550 RepID=UPI000FE4339B
MTAPNRNTLWAESIVSELVANDVESVCVAPGSRSTPLTVAVANHPEIEVYSHLDERSAAFFALGRGRRTGEPTALICTSGTAAANFHPAVMEANEGRVPLLVLTADRPPELHDSGANQTTDQQRLYGNAVRYDRTLPEPEASARKLRSLRVTVSRAVGATTGTPPGPVHLNVPFRKPLEPTPVEGDIPEDFEQRHPLAADGRDGPFVERTVGESQLSDQQIDPLAAAIDRADRGLIVCGPAARPTPSPDALAALAEQTGYPVLADPLSGHRFGRHTASIPICGGYDSYLDGCEWPDPDIVLRFGASPTSKNLRKYLAGTDTRQLVVDPAGGWREAEFTATDLVEAAPTPLARALAGQPVSSGLNSYRERFTGTEQRYWETVEKACKKQWFEGAILNRVADLLPDPATCFVSNSMPVRDLDRFGKPQDGEITVLGNRGVSGIDGIISTGLGAGSATTDPLVIVLGDLALYHDMNGLLALQRCGVDATIVLIDNDGGGIFHKLPISQFDPPFTDQFLTPHGLDFAPVADLYEFEYVTAADLGEFADLFEASVGTAGSQIISVQTDSEQSHQIREQLHEQILDERSA